jgi:hypothetical protein
VRAAATLSRSAASSETNATKAKCRSEKRMSKSTLSATDRPCPQPLLARGPLGIRDRFLANGEHVGLAVVDAGRVVPVFVQKVPVLVDIISGELRKPA